MLNATRAKPALLSSVVAQNRQRLVAKRVEDRLPGPPAEHASEARARLARTYTAELHLL